MAIHSSGQTIFSFTDLEGITQGAGEEIDEAAGGAGDMGVDRTGASEGQAAGVYGQVL